MPARLIMKLSVAETRDAGGGARLLVLRHPARPVLPPPTPGAHVDIRLPDGRMRQYSLCGDPADATQYTIAVKLEPSGRGGSRWVHDNLVPGAIAHVSAPRNNFRLAPDADEHILIAGGIGVTPMVAMARHLNREGGRFVLNYCARSTDAPLLAEARALLGDSLRCFFSEGQEGRRLDLAAALAGRGEGAHVYCCGPARLVEGVRTATAAWPAHRVHIEMFMPLSDNVPARPFEIAFASSGRVISVPADKSALTLLRENGYALPSSCEIGVCGSCECGYLSGAVIHRDVVLNADRRHNRMLLCVSRAETRVVLDL